MPQQWATRLHGEVLPTGSVRTLLQGSVTMLPGFAEGQWWVQDAAAALPARLFGDVAGKTIADLCAAPGGKTAQLVAGRRARHRDRPLAGPHGPAARQSGAAGAGGRDRGGRRRRMAGRKPSGFDGILVDAPCASTGTIRRHPDVAWLRQEADIGALTALQKRLLQRAVGAAQAGRNAGLLHLLAGAGRRRAGRRGAARRRIGRAAGADRRRPRSPASPRS